MSGRERPRGRLPDGRVRALFQIDRPDRVLATGGVLLAILTYLAVLDRIVVVADGSGSVPALAALSLAGGTVLARFVRPRWALACFLALVAAGTQQYLASLPATVALGENLGPFVGDTVSLLTGMSILRIINADIWALTLVPAPTMFAWYLAVRRRYVAGATVAGATLGLLVLTGDAGTTTTLLGVVGVAAAAGFGTVETTPTAVDASRRSVLVGLGGAVVGASVLDVVPSEQAGVGGGGGLGGFGGGTTTTEANLLADSESLQIQGSISLSPTVRFEVESEQVGYWRALSFDRYSGRGWIRTGETEPYDSPATPPGPTTSVQQEFTLAGQIGRLPALWKPVDIDVPASVDAYQDGSLAPTRSLREDESYTVTSARSQATPDDLRAAPDRYPDGIQQRYLALPGDFPSRVADRTADIVGDAASAYDAVSRVEAWLESNRDYSLDVDRPSGDIADQFLFEMDAGYCTYFATTMIAMLRTQGIPARFTVGYTPGERVGESSWVVRGFDAHAWVEVYFPGYGWQQFDPTPAGPRRLNEQERLRQARLTNEDDVDTNETGPGEWSPTPTPTPTPDPSASSGDGTATPIPQRSGAAPPGLPETAPTTPTPAPSGVAGSVTREQAALAAVALAGGVAALRLAGVDELAYRAVWLRYQPRKSPLADVERAYARAEYALEARTRTRRPDETVRQYAAAVGDEPFQRLARVYERAMYAETASETDADDAVELADVVVGS
ncbi:transglutaminase domain-containing protein [Halosegnis longus]|uniref:transglutaminase domain-containing protein n=1 Tax=Halosegnis longus TaxID=2216012 RepID=UPI00096AB93B|nr:transglutaminase domain-containing protein [Salella cibi]